MRHGIGENGEPVAGYVGPPEKQVNEGRGQKEETRHSVHEMHHGIEIAEALVPLQPSGKEWIVRTEHLDHPTRPADSLAHVAGKAFGRETGGLRNVDVSSVPPSYLHAQGGVRVFGDRFGCDSADLLQRGTP